MVATLMTKWKFSILAFIHIRINQHIPANIWKGQCDNLHSYINTSGSAVTEN